MITTKFINSALAQYNDTDLSWVQDLLLKVGYFADENTGASKFQLIENTTNGHNGIITAGSILANFNKGGNTWKVIVKNDTDTVISIPQNTSGSTKYSHIVVKIDNTVTVNAVKSNVATFQVVQLATATPTAGQIQAVIGAGMDYYHIGYVTQVNNNPVITNAIITNLGSKVTLSKALNVVGDDLAYSNGYFSGTTYPASPFTGRTFYKTTAPIGLQFWNGSAWEIVATLSNSGNSFTANAGENITAGQEVYMKQSDGTIWKASSASQNEALYNHIGTATTTATTGNPVTVQTTEGSVITGQSFGTPTETIASTAFFNPTVSGTTNLVQVYSGQAPTYVIFSCPKNVGNLEKVEFKGFNQVGTGGGNVTLKLYKPTITNGSALTLGTLVASVQITSISTNTATYSNVFTFASPVDVQAGEVYCFYLDGASGNASNYWNVVGNQNTYGMGGGLVIGDGTDIQGQNEIAFKMYNTKKVNYSYNGNVFLGNAGASQTSYGTNIFPIGKLIASTSFIKDKNAGKSIIPAPQVYNTSITSGDSATFVQIPLNARTALVKFATSTGASSSWRIVLVDLKSQMVYEERDLSTYTISLCVDVQRNVSGMNVDMLRMYSKNPTTSALSSATILGIEFYQ